MKKIICILLSIGIIQSQTSLSEIKKLSNSELNILKENFQSQDESNINDTESTFEDVDSLPVEITKEEFNLIDEEFFGYNYFQKSFNFFDNVPTPSDYKLGVGDEIVISLWGEVNIREKFVINKEGLIYYDNIGFINLSNNTISEAEGLLTKELSTIYSTLKGEKSTTTLMLELGKLKSLNVYFSGEVYSPGIQLIHPFSDVYVALVQAGGIRQEGSLRNIQIIRNQKVIHTVDFYTFFNEGTNTFSNINIIDGDIIHVPAIKNRVEILGEVLRPGFYETIDNDSVADLIDYAAGLNAKASSIVTIDTVKPINDRISQDNIISSLNVDITKNDIVDLNNGDVVTVREVGSASSKVQIFGRVKVPGKYAASGMSLKNLLDIAGGFDDPIFRKTIRDDQIIILRKDSSQFYSKEFEVSYIDAQSFPLEIDDKVFVYENTNYENNFTYRVEGEVNKPGTYPLKKGITVGEALKLAGGISELSTFSNIILSQEFTELNEFDEEITISKNVASVELDFQLDPNTVIKALPFENVVSVEGNVYNPGLVAYSKNLTMTQAIVQAGGYKPYSIKRSTYVKRANGEIDKVNLFGGRVKRLMPGDQVFVPLDPNPSDFDITTFLADLASTLANIAAILIIVDNQNN